MAERPGGRRRSRRDSMEAGSSLRGTPPASKDRRTKRSSKPSKERWLLTRKTWRYMTDAGRRLIPDGVHNRTEDIPKIEQYFQEVCQREPRFLLWRKSSYPGTLGFRSQRRRRRVKGGSCRVKASSADEADEIRDLPKEFVLQTTTVGKFDLAKAKRDFFLASDSGGSAPSSPVINRRRTPKEDAEVKVLADMLQKYLNMQGDVGEMAKALDRTTVLDHIEGKEHFDYQSLIDKLQQHLDLIVAQAKREDVVASNETMPINRDNVPKSSLNQPYQSDYVHKSLMETLSRYYSKSPTRERVISDILTDRKLLEKLYFDLRCTRGFRGPRATGAYTSPSSRWWAHQRTRNTSKENEDWYSNKRDPISPPPLIAVQEPSTDRGPLDDGVQTDPVPQEVLDAIILEKEKEEISKSETNVPKASARRRSSVDNDDVSPSVSDTIKRYLRMARKKSMDADKVDRFKRVNYDRNLRNIRAKGEITKPGDDDGNNKGCQTDDNWVVNYRQMSSVENPSENLSDGDTTSAASRNASSRSSIDAGLGSEEPLTPKHHHHQSFLSHLLHGSNTHKDKPHSAPGSPALTSSSKNSSGGTAMQKSKSSSSVVHHGSRLVAKKIWRSRSKSTSRASNQPSIWTPQGKCTWAGTGGRRVTLQNTSLRSLSEIERKVLCRVAVAKLQTLNLGVHIRPPSESLGSGPVATKPKRRAYLLKRKALTTGFFESKGKDEKDKEPAPGGLVFGIPISQCLENDRIARIAAGEVAEVGSLTRSSRHGSRTSFSSLIEAPTVAAKTEDGGSCESLPLKGGGVLTGSDSGVLELSDSGGGGTSGEWDAVPGVVRQCIRHLEATGLRTLGIFRVSPSKKRVRQLREDFDCGRETKIGPDQCPHDVATLLKEFFRDLPDPLLCRDLYQAFVHTQKIRNRRLQQEALQHLIQLLPTPNRETLWALLHFLSIVASNSEDQKDETGEWIPGNKMDTNNLATVFAPNILHYVKPGQTRPEVSAERAEERIDVINVVRALLEHASTLFTVPAALLDELYMHMMDTHPAELDLVLSRRAEEQCGDEVDPCSEAENFSVEETVATSGNTSTPATTTTRKVWTREECLHQTAGVGGDIGPRPRRPKRPGTRRKEEGRSNSVDSGSSEDPTDPRRRSSPMVITASLTIPMSGAFTLNLDDPDIPYIEETPKQPSAPPRRQRQRSISGCSEGGRHGSDSAVGSSATLSGDQVPSSPPSWASTPPASPDSAVTAVSYIPDQQAVLQRVSFTTSSEVRQVSRGSNQEVSRSSGTPYTPSITSIGGAVLRSKTADIERMLHINRSDPGSANLQHSKSGVVTTSMSTTNSSESKKYTKRRYTDSRHQTRHIPDLDTLAGKTTTMTVTSSMTMSSSTTSSSSVIATTQNQRGSTGTVQPVWKRRELISSAPKGRENYF